LAGQNRHLSCRVTTNVAASSEVIELTAQIGSVKGEDEGKYGHEENRPTSAESCLFRQESARQQFAESLGFRNWAATPPMGWNNYDAQGDSVTGAVEPQIPWLGAGLYRARISK
jgi:hypothetical protein